MTSVLAKNVKTIRELKHWTQQHLADTAGILLRTVQRIERGDGASLETLGALANAFGVTIRFLNEDIDALLTKCQEAQEAMLRAHDLVDVAPVTCAAHLEAVGGSQAYFTHCVDEFDAVGDAFSALASTLRDMGEIWNESDPMHRRGWVKDAYQMVEELNRCGIIVSLGKADRMVRAGSQRIRLRTLILVAWPKGQECSTVAVPKDP